jgi:cell division protein FtsW
MTKTRYLLFLMAVVLIFMTGLVMIFNTSSADVLDHALSRSTNQALLKQLAYAAAGVALAWSIWKMGYQRLLAWTPFLLGFFTILLVLVLIPGIGREVNGSRRWIGIAGFSFQPSEFVKYFVPAYFIHRMINFGGRELTLKEFMHLVGQVAVPIVLVLIEPNNGTAGVIGLTLVVMCVITGVPVKYWAMPLILLALIGAVFAYNVPYVTARIQVYLHPELDLKGKGHQPYQAKIAAGAGRLLGRGPGNSLQKFSYLPEAQNDYIAAIYAEEFGFVGMAILIVLYMTIGFVGFTIAYNARDREGFYLATAATFLICFQAFMNLGVVSGLLPSTGLNLPLFSQGGTSLMANVMGLGILLSVAHVEADKGTKIRKQDER